MGEKTNRDFDGNGKTAPGATSADTETTGTETGTKRGRGRPRKSEQPGDTATETNIPKLVLVEEPGIEDEAGPQPAAKASKKKRKDLNSELKKDQIAVLLKTVFDIAASREGLELWKISQQEAELIADPLAQILNKNPFISGAASKYGDVIALIAAISTVIIPRLFVQFAAEKEKKKKEVTPYVPIRQINDKPNKSEPAASRNESGTPGISPKQPNRKPTNSGPIFSQELHSIIPAIQ